MIRFFNSAPAQTRPARWLLPAFFALFSNLPTSKTAAAPTPPGAILERSVDLDFQNTPLKDALAIIAQKAGFQWSYNAAIIEGGRKTSLAERGISVREALVRLLGDGYEFRQNGNYLILKRRRRPETRLSGYITDPRTGRKMPNVTLYDRRTLRAAVTDSNGYYEMRVGERTEIVVAKLDYRETVLAVTPQTPRFVKIEMLPDSIAGARKFGPENPPGNSVGQKLEKTERTIVQFFTRASQEINAMNVRQGFRRRFAVSVLPWLGTNHLMSGNVSNGLSINALVGLSRSSRVLEVAGIGNITRSKASGFQAAGAFNILRGDLAGVQAAGLLNITGDRLAGGQMAGLCNFAKTGTDWGWQISGLTNVVSKGQNMALQAAAVNNHVARGNVAFQISGLLNTAARLNGIQFSGVLNTAKKADGLQVSGVLNTSERLRGAQFAGLMNVADSASGVQAAPFLNVGRRVRGVQIGLINVAGDVRGAQLGLLNFAKTGGYSALEISANEVFLANAAFKTGTPLLHFIYTGSLERDSAGGQNRWAIGLGLGHRARLGGRSSLSIELIHRHLNLGPNRLALQEWSQAALTFDLRLFGPFSLALGPTGNLFFDRPAAADFSPSLRGQVVPYNFLKKENPGGLRTAGWVGWTAGLRMRMW